MTSPTPSLQLALTHQRAGWSGFVFFSLVGILLEVLLAWKAPFLVDASHAERRHLLRLGHAHGTLVSLLQLAFCTTLPHLDTDHASTRLVSLFLRAALLLLPGGFLLGGLSAQEGDPGLPIVLVPLGGLLLVVGVMILTRELFRARPPGRS
jgi:cyanate permease